MDHNDLLEEHLVEEITHSIYIGFYLGRVEINAAARAILQRMEKTLAVD
jgi:hypothetical protein